MIRSDLCSVLFLSGWICAQLHSAAAEPSLPKSIYPGAAWETKSPGSVGLSEGKLKDLAQLVGGRGCVVRHGYMIYTWGDASRSSDVASAFKPVLSTLLFLQSRRASFPGADRAGKQFEPHLLKQLNQGKDGGITWRHLASQTSGYGLVEAPGEAYAYNDFALALYYDTLTLKVFGTNGTELLREPWPNRSNFKTRIRSMLLAGENELAAWPYRCVISRELAYSICMAGSGAISRSCNQGLFNWQFRAQFRPTPRSPAVGKRRCCRGKVRRRHAQHHGGWSRVLQLQLVDEWQR